MSHENSNQQIDLISYVPDQVFSKPGSYYQQKSKRKSSRRSTTSSELTFRQKVDTVDGKKQDFVGASDPQDPQNLEKFELAGIPIDKMKDPRQKPDDYNGWKWDKKEKKWLLVGEEKIKLPTGKIIKISEWNDMIRNHTSKI
uniref:Uncharacterized protein n=1 Tax=Palisada sp. TaxID=1955416 RepID=A0A1Z1MRR5_9FLOR|nr:hypothetical protein [Palisada sp.]